MSGEADELIAARQAILTFSDKPGFVQALRRLERAALAAGPRSPEAAQAPLLLFPIYCDPDPLSDAFPEFDQQLSRLAGLYSGKCDECTTGISCEEAGECLFEG